MLLLSLNKLVNAPLSSSLTLLMIGTALALPGALYVLLLNLQSVAGGWEGGAQVSLYLQADTSPDRTLALAKTLEGRSTIARAEPISADQALDDFRESSGLAEVIDSLDANPLPPVLVLTPSKAQQDPAAIQALTATLGRLPEVDRVHLDMQWLQRLRSLIAIARRTAFIVGAMLAGTVLLVIINTIRLDIEARREEIEVTKLIGATNAFIRRPFLYGGLWYGIIGGLVSVVFIHVALALLDRPTQQLAGLYDSRFALQGLGPLGVFTLLGTSIALGLAGSWLAVGRHLGSIEPS